MKFSGCNWETEDLLLSLPFFILISEYLSKQMSSKTLLTYNKSCHTEKQRMLFPKNFLPVPSS